MSRTVRSRLAFTTKSTLTVATWCTRPVDRPSSTISAMRSTASPIVTSSIGTPMITAVRSVGPLMTPTPSRAVRTQSTSSRPPIIRAHSRTFHSTIAGAWSNDR